MKAPVLLLLLVTFCLFDRLTLMFALEVPLVLGMFGLDVLGHGALGPIGLPAAGHRTNIIPLNLIGTPSNSLFVLILFLLLLLLEQSYRVRQFFLLLQRRPQLFAQSIILNGQLRDLVGVVL